MSFRKNTKKVFFQTIHDKIKTEKRQFDTTIEDNPDGKHVKKIEQILHEISCDDRTLIYGKARRFRDMLNDPNPTYNARYEVVMKKDLEYWSDELEELNRQFSNFSRKYLKMSLTMDRQVRRMFGNELNIPPDTNPLPELNIPAATNPLPEHTQNPYIMKTLTN